MIRKAKICDIRSMHVILSEYAARGLLLGRSLSDLYAQLRDFIVVEEDYTHEIVGTCSLRICWEDIAEIRSLAVREDFRGSDLGRAMVEICIKEASDLGLKKLFVLTYVPAFFEKLGFIVFRNGAH